MRFSIVCAVTVLCICGPWNSADAQLQTPSAGNTTALPGQFTPNRTPATEARAPQYAVELKVLTQALTSDRIHCQTWGKILFKMGQRATFGRGTPGEASGVEEVQGKFGRSVKVVGIMNRNGSITFGNQTFVAANPEPLRLWLEKLAQYGASGPPNESSTWGLNDDQFTQVLKMLGQKVTEPVRLTTPLDAIDSLQLPAAFRISFTDAAAARDARGPADDVSTEDFRGLTKGSVLAAALARFGLGFRPKADRKGEYVIEVDAGNESDNMYPVGWKNTAPIVLVVPELAKPISVDLEDVPLDALIQVIAEKLKRPHFYSTFELQAAGQDPAVIKYSRKPDRLSLYSLIVIVSKTHHIGLSLRTDEAGSVFLWITTEEDEQAFKKRFAHVQPAA